MKNFNPERIIGGTDSQKEGFKVTLEQAAKKSGEELFGELLLEPTPEEKLAIATAVEYVNRISKKYGAEHEMDENRIFLLEKDGISSSTNGRLNHGMCDLLHKCVAVDESLSNAILSTNIVHEGFHITSYHSFQIMEDNVETLYRGGISMVDRKDKGIYLAKAEEAIIATLSQNFFEEVICKDPFYAEEIRKTLEVKTWLINFASESKSLNEEGRKRLLDIFKEIRLLPDVDSVYFNLLENNEKGDLYKFGYFTGYFEEKLSETLHERAEERKVFNEVLDRLVVDSKGVLGTKEELFDHFARAHFTGNYFPLARLIDGALEKGSFRKVAIELGNMYTETE
jgi:hypothetical protein